MNLLLALFFLQNNSWAGGFTVNNGGDAVICRPAPYLNQLNGYYSLDFMAQFRPEFPPVRTQSIAASLRRIEKELKTKLPELSVSFSEFIGTLFNETFYEGKRIWEKAAFGLVDLKDENFVSVVPTNCLQNGKLKVVQAVIRQDPSAVGLPKDKVLYRYVPEVINNLAQTNPLQLSFLLVHEWLWDFSDNVERNRRINYLLHSKNLELWDRASWISALKNLGFNVNFAPPPKWDPNSPKPPPRDSHIPPVRPDSPLPRKVNVVFVTPVRILMDGVQGIFKNNNEINLVGLYFDSEKLKQDLKSTNQIVDIIMIDVTQKADPNLVFQLAKEWPKIKFIALGITVQRLDYMFCQPPYFVNFISRENSPITFADAFVTLFENKTKCLQ